MKMVVLIFALLLVAAFKSPLEENDTLKLSRKPSIQQCASDSAVIAWKTDKPAATLLQYGTDGEFSQQVLDTKSVAFHVAYLRGLKSDTKYNYRVQAGKKTLYESYFRTYPGEQDERYSKFSFWGLGDGGSGNENQYEVSTQIQKLVENRSSDFGIYLGDIVYDRGKEEDQDPAYFTPYQNILDKQVCWPSLGNHDYKKRTDSEPRSAAPYYSNRILPVPSKFAYPRDPERWYAFQFGDALFIALDTIVSSHPRQKKFLRHTLETHADKKWKFVFFHHPPYATPYLNDDPCKRASEKGPRQHLAAIFEEYEVDVVFTGHNHSYQRSELRKDFFPEKKGVYYIVSGGGGESVRTVSLSDSTCQSPPLTQAFVQSDTYHFFNAGVNGNTFSLEAIDSEGNVFDRFEFTKHEYTNKKNRR